MRKQEKYLKNDIGLSYFSRLFNLIKKKIRLFIIKKINKEKYLKYLVYDKALNKVSRIQRLYYSKELDIITKQLKYNRKTIPQIYYLIDDNILKLKCYFNNRVIKNDYERLVEEITLMTGLVLIEKELINGICFLELGALNDEKIEPIFLKDITKEDTEHSIILGDSFGKKIIWDYSKNPHLIISGATGSGKTTMVNYVLSSLLMFSDVWCIDGKGVDYLHSSYHFEKYTDVSNPEDALDLLEQFYEIMLERKALMQSAIKNGNNVKNVYELGLKPIFLLIDENTSVVESLPSKAPKGEVALRSIYLNKLGQIARLGRAFGTLLILVMQRPDAKIIEGETRNNFTCRVVLGSPEEESYRMVFGNNNANLAPLSIGKGYVQLNSKVSYFKVPYLKDIISDKVKEVD